MKPGRFPVFTDEKLEALLEEVDDIVYRKGIEQLLETLEREISSDLDTVEGVEGQLGIFPYLSQDYINDLHNFVSSGYRNMIGVPRTGYSRNRRVIRNEDDLEDAVVYELGRLSQKVQGAFKEIHTPDQRQQYSDRFERYVSAYVPIFNVLYRDPFFVIVGLKNAGLIK